MSTKGPRGGVFVMYNCARLHTLFDSYERGVEKGETHVSPPINNIDQRTNTEHSGLSKLSVENKEV